MKQILFFVVIFLVGICTSSANQQFSPNGQLVQVWIPNPPSFPPLHLQQTPYTCWAASFSNILLFYNKVLPESAIVSQITGQVRLAQPSDLNNMLNASYTDAAGNQFSVTAQITDNFTNTSHSVTNNDVRASLAANVPVLYGDYDHCMVMVAATFTTFNMNAIDAVAADPATGQYRHLTPLELQGMYAAILTVSP
jgi:hypothetical protein